MIKFILENFDTIFKNENSLETLNKIILDLAIKGKLVPQNENDEPAGELLKRIQAEKERLIKEKIIKKEKPLPEITEEEIPFDIPKNWEWTRLENIILKIKYGYTASAQNEGNIKLLRITDIQENNVIWKNVPYCDISLTDYENYKLEKSDILIARTGGTVGKTFLIKELPENIKSVYASYLIKINPSIEIFDEYLKKYFESNLYWEQLKAKSQGTGQPNVNAPALKSLIVPLPPIEEQKRIVKKVENLMEICNLLEEKINISKNISENLLKSFMNNGE